MYLYADVTHVTELNVTFGGEPITDYQFNGVEYDKDGGFMVYFTPPNAYPSPESAFVIASAGAMTTVPLSMVHMKLLSKAASPCTYEDKNVTFVNYLTERDTINFQQDYYTCLMEHMQVVHLQQCNCTMHRFPKTPNQANASFCLDLEELARFSKPDYLLETRRECLGSITKLLDGFHKKCRSQSPCSTLKYEAKWTADRWPVAIEPQIVIERLLVPALKQRNESNLNCPGWKEFLKYKDDSKYADKLISNNFIKLIIRPTEIESQREEEYHSYELKSLISDMGGILGFYIGVSVLTLCEVFHLLLNVIITKGSERVRAVDS